MIRYLAVSLVSLLAAWLLFGLVASCTPSTVAPPPDATDAAPVPTVGDSSRPASCMTACEHLHDLGCSDGADAGACAQACAHELATPGFRRLDLWCLSTARDRANARACGGVACQ